MKQRILYLITKSNFGPNKNYFLFGPVPKATADAESLRQAVGGPIKFNFV